MPAPPTAARLAPAPARISHGERSCRNPRIEKCVRLPRPVRHERGEGWGEGCPTTAYGFAVPSASSPRPSPPFRTEEREPEDLGWRVPTFAKTAKATPLRRLLPGLLRLRQSSRRVARPCRRIGKLFRRVYKVFRRVREVLRRIGKSFRRRLGGFPIRLSRSASRLNASPSRRNAFWRRLNGSPIRFCRLESRLDRFLCHKCGVTRQLGQTSLACPHAPTRPSGGGALMADGGAQPGGAELRGALFPERIRPRRAKTPGRRAAFTPLQRPHADTTGDSPRSVWTLKRPAGRAPGAVSSCARIRRKGKQLLDIAAS